MTTTEIIQELDELRAKGNEEFCKPQWTEEHLEKIQGLQAEFHQELGDAYPALRQAVLDGERYKAAGEALAKAVDGQAADTDYSLNHALTAYRTAIDDSSK